MSGIPDIAASLADGAAARLVYRATREGARATDALGEGTPYAVESMPLRMSKREERSGLNARILVSGGADKDPELFYGPFLQLGTFLDIGPTWLNIGIDIATDPLAWVIPGGGGLLAKSTKGARGLTAAGKQARLVSAMAADMGEATGEVIVGRMLRTLRAAGTLAGPKRKALIDAAKGGKREFAKIMKDVLKADDIAPEIRPLFEAMVKDRRALAELLDTTTTKFLPGGRLSKGALKESELLGKTALELRKFGQANPFLRVAVPDVKHPLNFARQVIGIGYKDEQFLFPLSRLEFGVGVEGGRGAVKAARAAGKTGERELIAGQIRADDAAYVLKHNMVHLGVPLDSAAILHAETGLVDEKVVNALMKSLPKGERTEATREKLTQGMLLKAQETMRHSDRLLGRKQAEALESIIESGLPFGPHTEAVTQGVDNLRRWHDLNNIDGVKLAMEANNPSLAINARIANVDLIANRHNAAAHEVIANTFKSKKLANDFETVMNFIIEQPERWVRREVGTETRAFLKTVPEDDGLLALRISQANDPAGLTRMLVEDGVPAEALQLVDDIDEAMKVIGKAKQHDLMGMKTLLTNYWHRSVKQITKKGAKHFKTGRTEQMNLIVEDLLSGTAADSLAGVSEDLSKSMRIFAKDVRQGKIAPLQMRKVADELAAKMESLGLIKYEKNALSSFATWQSALGRADASNLIVRDFMEIGGNVNWLTLPDNLQGLIPREGAEDLRNFYTRGTEPPLALQANGAYRKLRLLGDSAVTSMPQFDDFIVRVGDDISDFMGAIERQVRKEGAEAVGAAGRKESAAIVAQQKAALDDIRKARLSQPGVRAIRQSIGEAMHGKQSIRVKPTKGGKTTTYVFKVDGERVPFDKSWITEAGPELPRGMADRATIERVLRARETTLFNQAAARRDKAVLQATERAGKRAEKAITKAEKAVAKAQSKAIKEIRAAVAAGDVVRHNARKARWKFLDDAAKSAGNEVVWARADFAPRMAETLKAYAKPGSSSQWLRHYDNWNYGLKSVKLGLDIFHYNVLAISQFVGSGPMDFMRLLVDPDGRILPGAMEGAFGTAGSRAVIASPEFRAARLRAAAQGGIGAVSGAGVGATMSDEPGDIATFSLVGAIYGAALGAARLNAVWANRFAMNPQNNDTLMWMGRGLWTGRPDDRAIGGAERMLHSLGETLSSKGIPGKGITDAVANGLDVFSRELWETLHNGSKHFYFAQRWGALEPKLRASKAFQAMNATEQMGALDGLARELMQSANNAFGGQNWATVLEHPEMERVARRVLLAPDWTSSRLQIVGNMMLNMNTPERALVGAAAGQAMEFAEHGFDPDELPWRGALFGAIGGPILGKWAARAQGRLGVGSTGQALKKESTKMVASALIGGYAFMNALNFAFNGRFMWDNEDGHKLQVALPGKSSTGGTQYVGMGKAYMEAFEFAGITDKDSLGAIPVFSRLRSKASVPVGAAITLFDNKAFFGPIATVDDSAVDVISAVASFTLDTATPIFATGPQRLASRALFGDGANAADVGGTAIRLLGLPVTRGRRGPTASDINFALPPIQGPPPGLVQQGLLQQGLR